jgi:hypothetical protein
MISEVANMPDEKNNLYLFEALELRAEYDARIKTLKDCLPESRKNRDRFSFSRDDDKRIQPSDEFDVKKARKQVRDWENKKRKLNSAIQKANFSHQVQYQGETIDLSEALEMRKGLNETIGEHHTQVVDSSFQRVIYKEDRDIVEPNELSYTEAVKNLEESRLRFRELNWNIRLASFTVVVDYFDEK